MMTTETFAYEPGAGYSLPALPALDSQQTLLLIFGASEFFDTQGPIHDLCRAYPRSHIIGCSTSGEILGTKINDHSLSIAVTRFARTGLRTASAPIAKSTDSFAAGETIARQLLSPELRGVFVLSDGLRVNGSDLARGINSVLPAATVVTGGLAGDGDRFSRTWVIRGRELATGWISAVGLYGDAVRIGHGSKGGWDIFGPPRLVTRSSGNVLFELDGQPALDLYRQYLGELAAGLPAAGLFFPLALLPQADTEQSLVRTILAVDEKEHSLTFAGDIPQGSRAQLMRANLDRLIEGAAGAAQHTLRHGHGTQTLCVAISCVGRRLVLGERTEEEVEATLEVLPGDTQQVGFYSYGELSPFTDGACSLHNQTMTLTTLSEA